MVHGASTNVDTEPRKALVLTFTPVGLEIGLPEKQEETRLAYNTELRPRLRSDHRHIIPNDWSLRKN